MDCAVYILTNKAKTVLYTGITKDLPRRIMEHRTKTDPKSFTAKYKLTNLVWYGITDSISEAIGMEKRIKGGSRAKKIALIEERNPQWKDLSDEVLSG